jgi:radical SAM protein with 4Fe4S-binding SPASM domain
MEKFAKSILHQIGIYNLRENSDLKIKQFMGKPYYWTSYPMAVQIDTTNKCGPKYSGIFCSYCHPQGCILEGKDVHTDMKQEHIDWLQADIARNMPKLLDGSWPPKQQVCYFLNGDPMHEERLTAIIEKHHNLMAWLPNQIFSCATIPSKVKKFCNPFLDWVCVTCSAPNSEVYKTVHGGDKFEDVLKSMQYIDENAYPNQHLEVHYVVTKDNFSGMRTWFNLMGNMFPHWKRVLSPLVKSPCNKRSVAAMGDLTLEQVERRINEIDSTSKFWNHQTTALKQPCVLWNNCAVSVHGDILQCCNWSDNSWNYGNIQEYIDESRSLFDYHLEKLSNKQRNNLCRDCNLKHPNNKQRLKNIQVNVRVKA